MDGVREEPYCRPGAAYYRPAGANINNAVVSVGDDAEGRGEHLL